MSRNDRDEVPTEDWMMSRPNPNPSQVLLHVAKALKQTSLVYDMGRMSRQSANGCPSAGWIAALMQCLPFPWGTRLSDCTRKPRQHRVDAQVRSFKAVGRCTHEHSGGDALPALRHALSCRIHSPRSEPLVSPNPRHWIMQRYAHNSQVEGNIAIHNSLSRRQAARTRFAV